MATGFPATQVLTKATLGDQSAADRLMSMVYDELKALAAYYMQQERPDHTMQPTALVHEAWLRLIDQTRVDWKNRTHFFAVAAEVMRRTLVDHARKHRAVKRGGDWSRVTLDEGVALAARRDVDLFDLDEAMNRLSRVDPRQGRVVELRFFGGLTNEQVAGELNVSLRTVEGDWRMARAWLRRELSQL